MAEKISESEIRARAYEILYHKYRGMHEQIRFDALNKSQHGQEEDKVRLLSDIGNVEKYGSMGFLRESDLRLIRTLEYVLVERNSLD